MSRKKTHEILTANVDYMFRIPAANGVHTVGIANRGTQWESLSPLTGEQLKAYAATGKAYHSNGARVIPQQLQCDNANTFDTDPALTVKTPAGDRNLADVVVEMSEKLKALRLKSQESLGKKLFRGFYQNVVPLGAMLFSPTAAIALDKAVPTPYHALGWAEGVAQFGLGLAALVYFGIKCDRKANEKAREQNTFAQLGNSARVSLLEHYVTTGKIPATYCIPK